MKNKIKYSKGENSFAESIMIIEGDTRTKYWELSNWPSWRNKNPVSNFNDKFSRLANEYKIQTLDILEYEQ